MRTAVTKDAAGAPTARCRRRGGAALAVLLCLVGVTACTDEPDHPLAPVVGADAFVVADLDGVPVVVGINAAEGVVAATSRLVPGRAQSLASWSAGVGADGSEVLAWAGSDGVTSFVRISPTGTEVVDTGVRLDTGLATARGDDLLALLPAMDGARLTRARLDSGSDGSDMSSAFVPRTISADQAQGFLTAAWEGSAGEVQVIAPDGTAGDVTQLVVPGTDIRDVRWSDGVVVVSAAFGADGESPVAVPEQIELPGGGQARVIVERAARDTVYVSMSAQTYVYDTMVDGTRLVIVRERRTGVESSLELDVDASLNGLRVTADDVVLVLGSSSVLVHTPTEEVARLELPGPTRTVWPQG